MSTVAARRGETEATARASPYVGLTPFTEADAPFFFGRESRRQVIVANLLASRLTLVYGPSGVGKTSLLHAGVYRDILSTAQRSLEAGRMPETIGVVFGSWRDDSLVALAQLIEVTISGLLGDLAPRPVPPSTDLPDLLGHWTARLDERAHRLEEETGVKQPEHVDLLIVLDQFEEYFVYHPGEAGAGTFATEFPRAVNQRTLRANFLVALREDAYTLLDRFEDDIPNLFGNNIRVEHLDGRAAERAIRGPVERYAELYPQSGTPTRVDDELVKAVVDQVRTGSDPFGRSGAGAVEQLAEELSVETPFLQLVMERIWAEEVASGSESLRLATLERLGGAQTIVQQHLGRAVEALDAEARELAAAAFGRLVTPSGSKIAYLASDLAEQEEVPPEQLADVLRELARLRILRAVAPPPGESEPRFEIFHDVLARPILDWRAHHQHNVNERRLAEDLAKQQAESARQRSAARRFRGVAAAAVLLALVAGAFAFWALRKQHEANQDKKRAHAAAEVTQAANFLATNPVAALRKALAAHAGDPSNSDAIDVLRRAAVSSRLVAVLRRRAPVVAAAFAGSPARVATVDRYGVVDLWNVRTGGYLATLSDRKAPRGRVRAVFSSDGRRLAVVHLSTVSRFSASYVTVWDTASRRLLGSLPLNFGVVALSPNGRFLAYAMRPEHSIDLQRFHQRIIRVWEVTPHGLVLRRSIDWLRLPEALGISEHGDIVTNASPGSYGEIWRAGSQTPVPLSPRPLISFGFSESVVYNRDATLVATLTEDGVARVFNVRTGRLVTGWRNRSVTAIAAAPDGGFALSGDTPTALLWSPGKRGRRTLVGHTDAVNSVAFDAGGGEAVTTSSDRTVRVWDAVSGELLGTLVGDTDRVGGAVFSPDGSLIVETSDDGYARVSRSPVVQPLARLPVSPANVARVAFSDDGDFILAAGASAAVAGPPWQRFEASGRQVALAPGGRLVVARRGGGVSIWNLRTRHEAAQLLQGERVDGVVAKLGPAQRWAVALTRHHALVVFDTTNGRIVRTIDPGPRFRVDTFATSANGRVVAVLETTESERVALTERFLYSAKIAVWDVESGTKALTWSQPVGKFDAVFDRIAVDRTGRYVVAGADDGTAVVWRLPFEKPWKIVRTHVSIGALAFSPTRNMLAVADGGSVDVLNFPGLRKLGSLTGHTGPVDSVAFSADGRAIVTASEDGTERVWDARKLRLWIELDQGRAHPAVDAALDPVAGRIVIVGKNEAVAIYRCPVCGDPGSVSAFAEKQRPVRSASGG